MPKTVFILSSGRTGTKFLAEFFAAHAPHAISVHEPPPSYHLRMLSNAYLAGAARRSWLVGALKSSRAAVIRQRARNLYVESNPFLFGFADVVNEIFENPLVFHIVRDPREFVRSAINHGSSTGLKRLVSSLIPFWFPDVRNSLNITGPLSMLGVFAGQWRLVNEFLSHRGGSLRGYRVFKFEDVFGADRSGLREMCGILDVPYPDRPFSDSGEDRVNVSKLKLMGKWPDWTKDQCLELDRICGDLMREYGYGGESEWEKMLGE